MGTKTIARASAPTPKQLNYLRMLAGRTGTTFAPPLTRREASREISRLKRLLASAGSYRELPDREEEPPIGYATAPARGEVHGRGADASWRKPSPEPERRPVKRIALMARYQVGTTRRAVFAERDARGPLRLVDRPVGGEGRAHLIDRDLQGENTDALRALVADYLRSAERLGRIPMAADGDV